MRVALFGEDRFCKPLHTLAKRILGEQAGVILRYKKRGDLLNKQKVLSHIETDILQEHPDASRVIICVDSECTPEEEMNGILQKIEKEIQKDFKGLRVKYCLVVHALEGWLLADPDAIREYLGPRAKINIPSSATSECNPKEIMRDIFRKADKKGGFLPPRDNPRIAEKIDINKMAQNNESFARFCEKIKDP